MAKVKLMQFELIAMLEDSKRLIDFLQKRGIAQLSDTDHEELTKYRTAPIAAVFDRKKQLIESAVETLERCCKIKRSIVQQLTDYTEIDYAQYRQITEQADSVMALTHTLSENLLNENKDNLLSVAAIFNLLQDYSDAQIDSIIQTLDPKVREMEDMRQLESSIKVRLVTGEGKPFKDFTIMQPDGKAVSLSDFAGKGKYILLDFWASWCGPCKREIPAIKAAYDKFHGPDFDIVSVAVWEQSVSASIDTAKVYGIQWNHILDAKEVPTKLYGVDGIPHLILIGPDGTILKRGLRGEEISAEIGKYIAPVK